MRRENIGSTCAGSRAALEDARARTLDLSGLIVAICRLIVILLALCSGLRRASCHLRTPLMARVIFR